MYAVPAETERPFYSLDMRNELPQLEGSPGRLLCRVRGRLPRPSPQFRRLSWLAFQKALDPLAPPKPLRNQRPR